MVKNPPANARDAGSIPRSGRFPVKGNSNPLMVFLLGKSHGQRGLVGYSPWGCKRIRHDLVIKQHIIHLYIYEMSTFCIKWDDASSLIYPRIF